MKISWNKPLLVALLTLWNFETLSAAGTANNPDFTLVTSGKLNLLESARLVDLHEFIGGKKGKILSSSSYSTKEEILAAAFNNANKAFPGFGDQLKSGVDGYLNDNPAIREVNKSLPVQEKFRIMFALRAPKIISPYELSNDPAERKVQLDAVESGKLILNLSSIPPRPGMFYLREGMVTFVGGPPLLRYSAEVAPGTENIDERLLPLDLAALYTHIVLKKIVYADAIRANRLHDKDIRQLNALLYSVDQLDDLQKAIEGTQAVR